MSQYSLTCIDSRHYVVVKDGRPTYNLRFKVKAWSCDCPARKHCKHLDMLPQEALVKRFDRETLERTVAAVASVFDGYVSAVCGSYRRRASTSKDLDILVVADEAGLAVLVKRLKALPYFRYVSGGNTKITGYLWEIPIDIDRVDEQYWWAHVLYRTGPKELNIEMRRRAKERGFTLNEYYRASSEAEIFEAVGMEYVRPENR